MTDKGEAARQKAKALARWEGEGGALGLPDAAFLAKPGAARSFKTPQACTSSGMPRASHAIERFVKEHKDRGRRAPGE
jgi:hypothetical protein